MFLAFSSPSITIHDADTVVAFCTVLSVCFTWYVIKSVVELEQLVFVAFKIIS